MTMDFHKIRFCCPDCQREITITGVLVRADGHLLFEGLCAPCGHEHQAILHSTALIIHAYRMDVNDCKQEDPTEKLILEQFAKLDSSKKVH